MHPVLNPALGRVWHDERTLQIGLDPTRARLLTCADPATVRLLAALDGSRDRSQVIAHARHLRIPPTDAAWMLDTLAAHGLLTDARAPARALRGLPPAERRRLRPDLSAASVVRPGADGGVQTMVDRRRAAVAVYGAGRVGAVAAGLLAAAGVGRVLVDDPAPVVEADIAPGGLGPADTGRERAAAVADSIRTFTSGATVCVPAPHPIPAPHPADEGAATRRGFPSPRAAAAPRDASRTAAVVAVVSGDGDGPDPVRTGDRLGAAGLPHLHVGIIEGTGRVGPFVLPGRTSCARCHELYRRVRDPGPRTHGPPGRRPAVGGTAVGGTAVGGTALDGAGRACDSVLAVAVAAHAVLHVLTHLDGGRPPTVDGTLQVELPAGAVRRRAWQRHPDCPCKRNPTTPPDGAHG